MQYYSPSGAPIGKRDKSHMAEFSPNPDSRKKGEVSYSTYIKRLKEQKSCSDSYRVTINKMRHMQGLLPFKDIDEFLQIVNESTFDIGDEELQKYLLTYEVVLPPPVIQEKPNLIQTKNEIQLQLNKLADTVKDTVVEKKKIPEAVPVASSTPNFDRMKFLKMMLPYYEIDELSFFETFQQINMTINKFCYARNIDEIQKQYYLEINKLLYKAFSYDFWFEKYVDFNYETLEGLIQRAMSTKRVKLE